MAKSRSKVFGYAVVAAAALFFAIDISGGLIGKIATLEFKTNDQIRCEAIRITLRKSLNLLPWKLMGCAEVPKRP